MSANAQTVDMKERLSVLWIFILFNIVFADILSFLTPGALAELATGYAEGMPITPGMILVFAILLEIPIAMIVLSRVLKYKANRWANIIAAVITIVFVIGGGSTDLHYLFFATVEVVCMLLLIWYVGRWPDPARQSMPGQTGSSVPAT